ncbi:MAG: DHHW family protein [Christensenellales bacterium]
MKKRFRFNIVMILFIVPILIFSIVSLVDQDLQHSELEMRDLAKMPQFSLDALVNGTYTRDLEAYYADTFPLREGMAQLSLAMDNAKGVGENIDFDKQIDLGMGAVYSENPEDITPLPTLKPTPAEQPTPPEGESAPQPTPTPHSVPKVVKGPAVDRPQSGTIGKNSVLVVTEPESGYTRVMEVFYKNEAALKRYADMLTAVDEALGDDVTVYSMVAPTAIEWWGPPQYQDDVFSQKQAIEYINENMGSGVIPVDAYTMLEYTQSEYLYFRSDHHWTARGAYYAYLAFCESAGLDAVSIDELESGVVGGFLGTYYTTYGQVEALANAPDEVEYFIPKTQTYAVAYQNAQLQGEYATRVLNPELDSGNKYLMFTNGDQTIMKVETNAGTGRKIMVSKESYGNALIPWLANNYDEIWVIDPRKDDVMQMDLPSFMEEHGIKEMLFVNYSFATSSESFVNKVLGML